mgnify:FL=1|tara:strand:- start:614 stop:1036 length:423 start_codon:yes stop_codon:yes gene_type:complete
MSMLQDLAKRIPEAYIRQKPGSSFKAEYVSHGDITQILLKKHGPFSQRVIEVIRNADGEVHGCILECTFVIDGKEVVIQEAGECERPGQNQGLNLKNSVSDGLKRCAMRISVALELWCQGSYVLDRALEDKEGDSEDESE